MTSLLAEISSAIQGGKMIRVFCLLRRLPWQPQYLSRGHFRDDHVLPESTICTNKQLTTAYGNVSEFNLLCIVTAYQNIVTLIVRYIISLI